MIIYLISRDELITYTVPLEVKGDYWILNKTNSNILNIYANQEQWMLKSNYNYTLYNSQNQVVETAPLMPNQFYFLKSVTSTNMYLTFAIDLTAKSNFYNIRELNEINIGRAQNNHIIYNNSLIQDNQLKVLRTIDGFKVINLIPTEVPIFVNGKVISGRENIKYGDVIFAAGLKVIFLENMVIVNDLKDNLVCNLELFNTDILTGDLDEQIEDDNADILVYEKEDYFTRAPRFRSRLEPLTINVDAPPSSAENKNENPFVLTVGPMMTMGMTSVVMLYTSINNAMVSGRGIKAAIPQMVMSGAMLSTVMIWPIITRAYRKHKTKKYEIKRKKKYREYIATIKKDIEVNITRQRQIMMENHISVDECVQLITSKSPRLWERKIEDVDFLTVRLGLGMVPLNVELKFPEKHFTVDEDELLNEVYELAEQSHDIPGAPVVMSFLQIRNCGIMGNYNVAAQFIKSILLQILTFYSGDLVKIVVLTNKEKSSNWTWLKELQHNWNNEKEIRYFATQNEEITEITNYLDKTLEQRISLQEENKLEDNFYQSVLPYYFIVCDDYSSISDNKFIKKLLACPRNYGFSILLHEENVTNFPDECKYFINASEEISAVMANEFASGSQREFIAEFVEDSNLYNCSRTIANIPIQIASTSKGLPDSCSLLEIYNAGKVETLNSYSRWKNSDPTISLAAPIGYDTNGGLFKLDLHEKYHGPHGLIAGMTGSGKSEFIITFVLSMAINYHPDEVSFVLIDYKGGGLALAFENKEMGIRLPHIAGTITNLDVNELNRALISIEAELKRRQREFNKAREISGESTIDIYKYQRLYREGIVKEPISHLFLISDEFAELKAQQPEFMDQLISTARIGRSLGVHLILATQKPAGVVNDQIWSNAKFKVCLKVQDKADSKDMIQVPDAAELKNVGRFYLLVGYNDYFAMGQSAYCGMPYIPSDTIRKDVDTNLDFVNNIGYPIKRIDDVKTVLDESQGEVLLNVVKYLTNIADSENIKVKQLWLDKIPAKIYVKDLLKKYPYKKEDFIINPIIGEYDNPYTQSQHLFTLSLSNVGNIAIYGRNGSGKEDLLTTLIYSTITQYTPQEINFYVADCGAETLKQFISAPQVGDVVLSSENEKMINLFKLLIEQLNIRKKLFSEYGGDIKTYNSQMNIDKKMPYIGVIINGYESFIENFADLEDELSVLTREGFKYGIIFIVACSGINAIKLKIKQNFNYQISMQLIDFHDYIALFGSGGRMVPAEYKGRGLIKEDRVYEFQTASICDTEEQFKVIKELCTTLKNSLKTSAPSVPTLPQRASYEYVKNNITTLNQVPIGVEKETIKISTYDFAINPISIISAANIKNTASFVKELWKILLQINGVKTIFLDAAELIKTPIENALYYNTNFNDVISTITNHLETSKKDPNGNLVIIVNGVDELFNVLFPDNANKFKNALKNLKPTNSIKFIMIDSGEALKKYAYDDWMKENTIKNTGIWIGKGISDQSAIKIEISNYKLLATPLKNDMGYNIIEGEPILIKALETEDEQNNKG